MIWGESLSVPTLPGLGLIALATALSATAAWRLRHRRGALGLPVLLVLLAVPLVVVAGTVTVPNTFVNGEVADADQVNANFDAVEAAVNDNDARIGANESGVAANATGLTAETARAAFAESANAMDIAAETSRAEAAEQANADAAATAQSTATTAQAASDANAALIAALEARIAALEAGGGTPPGGGRFNACPDGLTVEDTETGVLWERKTTDGSVHDVSNSYSWSSTGTAADGTAYTVFLADLNASPGFAGHTDWRLPFVSELQSILIGPGVTHSSADVDPPDPAMGTNPTGQATVTIAFPAMDPNFTAVGGPTAALQYWSGSRAPLQPFSVSIGVWSVLPDTAASVFADLATDPNLVRAVRTGSCGP